MECVQNVIKTVFKRRTILDVNRQVTYFYANKCFCFDPPVTAGEHTCVVSGILWSIVLLLTAKPLSLMMILPRILNFTVLTLQ